MTSTRFLSVLMACWSVSGCVGSDVPLVSTPSPTAVCQALAPAFPLKYHGLTDSPDTIRGIQQANARYSAACR